MWVVSDEVARWRAEGRRAAVARVVSFSGFGGRRADEALAVAEGGGRSGSLLGGGADAAVESAARQLGPGTPAALVEVSIGDPAAIAAGLACGGVARVLVQDASAVPAAFWDSLLDRRPVALATPLPPVDEPPGGEVLVVVEGPAAESSGGDGAVLETARRLLAAGRAAVETVGQEAGDVLVEAFVPTTRLVVQSDPGELAGAIARQAQVLGWEPLVTGDAGEALAATEVLGPADAVVVLTHDHEEATPVLAAALGRGAFTGALGSRHTQQVRRERLAAAGASEEQLARVHGPVGLDIGARAPEETAVAICAEILASRSGRDGKSLAGGSGPING